MAEENHCQLVSSRGILKSCDIFSSTPISGIRQLINYSFHHITDNNQTYVMYVCISALPFFMHHVFKHLPFPIILVTGDNDETCPTDVIGKYDDFISFINEDKLIHWFSQNCIPNVHSKLTQIPIGLDYHTLYCSDNHSWGKKQTPLQQEETLMKIKENALPFWKREIKAHANYHFSMRYDDRVRAYRQLPKELVYYEPKQHERNETWVNQSKFAFVISPHGNGMDCHRTWEALCLGCIPIVRTSSLNPLYEGLPVLILSDWSDLTEELMQQTIADFQEKEFIYEKLSLKYWVDTIHSYK